MLTDSVPPYYPVPLLQRQCRRLSEHLRPWEMPPHSIYSHWVNLTAMAPGETCPNHIHPFHEGFLVLRGEAELSTRHQSQHLERGTLTFFSPGYTHLWRTGEEGCLLLVLCFDLDPPVQTPRTFAWPVYPALCWEAQWLFDDIQAASPGWTDRAHSRLGVFYAHLMHLFTLSLPAAAPPLPDLVARVDALLEAHLVAGITLDAVAEQLSMSVRHLTRQFRAHTGMTIGARLEAHRLERAAKLLRTTDLAIAAIARAVGLADADYFARRFTRRFDLLPSRYRRTQQQ